MNAMQLSKLQSRSESGQSLLEIALVLPLLMLLALGAIDMGRYAYIGILVANAARAGASYGETRPGDSAGIVTATCNDFLNNLGSNPAPSCDGSGSASNNHLQVQSSVSCGCDKGGTVASLYGGACDDVPNSLPTDPIPACQIGGGQWVAMVTVTVSGTFNALCPWPGIPATMNISRSATVRTSP